MAKVAFPTYDVQTINGWAGGIGTFIVHFARQLSARGDEVTIIAMEGEIDSEWRERYRSWGIRLVEVHNEIAPERWPKIWAVTISEYLTPLLRDFDIVYFCDGGNVAFNTVRMKRLGAAKMPVCVTVMHGSHIWCHVLKGGMLNLPDHLYQVFVEQYSARHSDYVIAPSRYMAKWANDEGWQLMHKPEILGLPFIPLAQPSATQCAEKLKRLIYFARLQREKGFDLFVDAILLLYREMPEILAQLDEVLLLGHEDLGGAFDWVRQKLRPTGLTINHIGDFNSRQAQNYLASHSMDALVVVPSAYENFPYAVIESSLISGLNIICTRGGGTPEIFGGRGDEQLFDPTPSGLAAKIRERLQRPLKPSELAQYDFVANNDRWLQFHERACNKPGAETCLIAAPIAATVDVCITYFNKPQHFPQLLQSLELQTFHDFRVIAVDDGSMAPNAAALFDYMAEKYRDRGWIFFRQNNQFVNAARNRAVERASAEYILFVDADDVLAVNAIERLLVAAQYSRDDCLTPGHLLFSSDQFPYDKRSGLPTVQVLQTNMPLGPALSAAVINPSILGSAVIMVRRSAFEAVGGYKELRSSGREDWELQLKLVAAGYRTDVVPEYLYYHRETPDGLSRNVNAVEAKRRLIGEFDAQLASLGLGGAASAMYFNLDKIREGKDRADFLSYQLRLTHERFNAFGFEPLAVAPAPTTVPASVAFREPIAHVRRTKILVVVPTLDVGGAEMDLVRNLPRLDRSAFEIAVFTFLARGALASQLAAMGIEIVGPFSPFLLQWFHDLKRAALKLRAELALLMTRSISVMRNFIASVTPQTMRCAWRRLRLWLRLEDRLLRTRHLRKMLRHIKLATKQLLAFCHAELIKGISALSRSYKHVARYLPPPLLRLVHEAIACPSYVLIGLGLVPFVLARRIDLIHAVLPNSYIVSSIAKLVIGDRPLVMSRVGLNSYHRSGRLSYFIERHICHRVVSKAIGNCEVILNELRDEGLPESKLCLIQNGIDIDDFLWQIVSRDGARNRFGILSTGIVISVVANLHAYKGHADLLHALHSVNDDMPDWTLLAVGRDVDGNQARLENLSDKLALRGRVRFLGGRSDVPTILSAADIHVSCSHTEGLPNNILEAMCAGLPVVATAVGGVGEVIVDGQTGVLVPPHDPVKLGEAIVALARDGDARRRLGGFGRRRVATHFAIDRSVDAFARLYAEVAASDRQPDSIESRLAARVSALRTDNPTS